MLSATGLVKDVSRGPRAWTGRHARTSPAAAWHALLGENGAGQEHPS